MSRGRSSKAKHNPKAHTSRELGGDRTKVKILTGVVTHSPTTVQRLPGVFAHEAMSFP